MWKSLGSSPQPISRVWSWRSPGHPGRPLQPLTDTGSTTAVLGTTTTAQTFQILNWYWINEMSSKLYLIIIYFWYSSQPILIKNRNNYQDITCQHQSTKCWLLEGSLFCFVSWIESRHSGQKGEGDGKQGSKLNFITNVEIIVSEIKSRGRWQMTGGHETTLTSLPSPPNTSPI